MHERSLRSPSEQGQTFRGADSRNATYPALTTAETQIDRACELSVPHFLPPVRGRRVVVVEKLFDAIDYVIVVAHGCYS